MEKDVAIGGEIVVQPKEIYLAQLQYNRCEDIRPCVVLELLPKDLVKVGIISSAMDLYDDFTDFLIKSSYPDFKETGLVRSSYISGKLFQDVGIGRLRKKIGCLKGELEREFDNWVG